MGSLGKARGALRKLFGAWKSLGGVHSVQGSFAVARKSFGQLVDILGELGAAMEVSGDLGEALKELVRVLGEFCVTWKSR